MVRVLVFLSFAMSSLWSVVAEMKINEVMYYQVSGGNSEFIEFYVTGSGDLNGYVVTDQDTSYTQYTFLSHIVTQGDYVVFYIGGDPANNNVLGNVHTFYQGRNSPYYNDGGDEVVLLKPSSTDTTVIKGVTLNAIPWDYMAYGTVTNVIPVSSPNNITLSWDNTYQSELVTAREQSISLTPNGIDGDVSACWEGTGSGNASDNACSGYVITRDTNTDPTLTYSVGETNIVFPNITLVKTSTTIYDPININTNPKAIPGAVVEYVIKLTNEGLGTTDAGTVVLQDSVPSNMKVCVATISNCQAISLVDGTPTSGLSLGTVSYSTDGTNFNYTPSADGEGYDSAVTAIQFQLNGAFAASDGTNHPFANLDIYMGVK